MCPQLENGKSSKITQWGFIDVKISIRWRNLEHFEGKSLHYEKFRKSG